MTANILKIISKRIKAERLAREWSQNDLANKCGLHRTYIGSIERSERNISIVNLEKIADAFSIEIADLLK